MADEKKKDGPPTKSYVVLEGRTHDGLGAGAEVELTDGQYKAFRDKVMPKGGKPSIATPNLVGPPADGSGSGSGAVGATHVPQDVGASTVTTDTNVGNRVAIVGNQPAGAPSPGSSASNTVLATGDPLSPDPDPDVVAGGVKAPKQKK